MEFYGFNGEVASRKKVVETLQKEFGDVLNTKKILLLYGAHGIGKKYSFLYSLERWRSKEADAPLCKVIRQDILFNSEVNLKDVIKNMATEVVEKIAETRTSLNSESFENKNEFLDICERYEKELTEVRRSSDPLEDFRKFCFNYEKDDLMLLKLIFFVDIHEARTKRVEECISYFFQVINKNIRFILQARKTGQKKSAKEIIKSARDSIIEKAVSPMHQERYATYGYEALLLRQFHPNEALEMLQARKTEETFEDELLLKIGCHPQVLDMLTELDIFPKIVDGPSGLTDLIDREPDLKKYWLNLINKLSNEDKNNLHRSCREKLDPGKVGRLCDFGIAFSRTSNFVDREGMEIPTIFTEILQDLPVKKVFLTYSPKDVKKVRLLQEELKKKNIEFSSRENLGPGESKPFKLSKMIDTSDFALVFISNSFNEALDQKGKVDIKAEINLIEEKQKEFSPAQVYAIPLLLEETKVPKLFFKKNQPVDLKDSENKLPEEGLCKLFNSIETHG